MREVLGVVTMRHVKAQVRIDTGSKITPLPERQEVNHRASKECQHRSTT